MRCFCGKSDVSLNRRIKSHRVATKKKKSVLYRSIRAFRGRAFHEVLLVGFPVNDPEWYRGGWTSLCPTTAANCMEPLDSEDIRATLNSLVEATFIALCQSFEKDAQYTKECAAVLGIRSGVKGLNGTPGTETAVQRYRGHRQHYGGPGLRPAFDVLRSNLLDEIRGEAGGLPRLTLKKSSKGNNSWVWRLPGMTKSIVLPQEDANLFGMELDAPEGEYQL